MSKIDLSKAKFGDKFRTIDGLILTYNKEYETRGIHILNKECGITYLFLENGNYMVGGERHPLDLVEQIFDNENEKDIATLERDKRINLDMAKVVRDIENEQQELQRRQEVVELARKMLFDDNTYQFYTQFYIRAKQNEGAEQVMTYLQYVMDYAEDCVNKFNQYIKEGKL